MEKKAEKKVTVNVAWYYFENKELPRGNRTWAFFMGKDMSDESKALTFTGKFNEAKKFARAKAAELGFGLVTLAA